MKSKYILILSVFLFFSCEDILKEKPEDFISPDQFFNSDAEAEQAIYGVYDFLNWDEIAGLDQVEWGSHGTDVGSGRPRLTRDGDLDNFAGEKSLYQGCYRAVGAANMVIARVEASQSISEDVKTRILAEAKFLRAYFYSRLNLFYGNVPLWLDELVFDEVEYLPNSTAAEVNAQVIADLEFASNNLPAEVNQKGRVTQWAAKGLLARTYLLGNEWQKAKNLATVIINNSNHVLLPEYADVFDLNNQYNAELLWVVPKLQDVKSSNLHSHSSPRPFDDGPKIQKILGEGVSIIRPDGMLTKDLSSRNPGSLQQGWGTIQVLKEYYDSFEPDDIRKKMWWHEVELTDGTIYEFTGGSSCGSELNGRSGYYPLKYIAWDQPANNGSRDVIMQRLSEIYLILAEAENELNGPTAVAYEAINTVRRRAFGGTENDLSGLSKDEFRLAIIDENKWELGCEGHRRYYLWHWGFETYQKAAKSVEGSLPLLIENLKPYHRYWKIPEDELEKNPNLVQNPGYN